MGLLTGKKGLIVGVANNRSIAWGIAQSCRQHGADLAFTYLNDALEKRVAPLAASVDSEILIKCDVQSDAEIKSLFDELRGRWDQLDFLVHSVAFASADDLKTRFVETSRSGFSLAMDVSVYSLIALTNAALPMMKPGSSVLTLSYLGAKLVVPNYRVMGVAKAGLEAAVRELAVDLGPQQVRVNAISAGPIKTLAAAGISKFRDLTTAFEARAPLGRMVTIEDVGDSAMYLLSDLARSVTGEVHYVDGGFNVTAA